MRALTGLVALLLIGVLVVVEVTMAPSAQERLVLYAIFGSSAVITAAVGWAMLRFGRRSRTLRTSVIMPPVAAVSVAAVVVAGAALTMFLSPHDLRLLIVALTLGVGLGWVLAGALVQPLTADLHRLAEVARQVAEGQLEVTTGIDRSDEIGGVATAIDAMIGRLAEAEMTRARNERARQDFLAAIGHDLRTPLASLQATVEALEDEITPDPARYLRSMSGDLEFLRGLVDDLFMLARIETGDLDLKPVTVDLTELCDEVLEAMRPLAERRRVQLDLAASVPLEVDADPRAVARVVRNLVDNAIRHTPEGSTVTVAINGGPMRTEVAVSDQGPGFPEAPQSDASSDGSWVDSPRPRDEARSGLGLTIARGLVAAHGGSIWVERAEGGRVVFSLGSPGVVRPSAGTP